MKLASIFPRREETCDFSRSDYEVVFSVFMVILAYFYRGSPLLVYPGVLYLFMSLLAANFAFNRILAERRKASLWLVDGMLLANVLIITAILAFSGGNQSYFWVLFLLPIFTAALTGRIAEVTGCAAACILALGCLSYRALFLETAQLFAFFVKSAVFMFSAFVIYRPALAKRRLEAEITFKRFQVEQLLASATVRDEQTAADASAAEVGRMSASLLHDIGNVITIILMSAEIMVRDEQPSKADADRVLQASRMAKSIVDGSLALIKGARYNFVQADIEEPLQNAVALFVRQARAKRVKLGLTVEPGLPVLKISVPHIQRVIINTIVNSLSFLEKGGTIDVRAARSGDGVLVTVADNGPGFPPAMLETGIKALGTTRKNAGGSGLGLYNSKEIVEKHGGTLSIRNNVPSGAVVEFLLPLEPPPAI